MKKLSLKCLLMATTLAGFAAPALAEDIVIDNVTLIDGTGQPKQQNMSVGIEKGRITFVTPTAAAPKVAGRRIDGSNKYLVPGFMDVHIHLKGPRRSDTPRAASTGPKYGASSQPDEMPTFTPEQMKVGHNAGVGALAGYLYSGVTTVYDAGNNSDHIMKLRAEERAGTIMAPHIFATGNLVTVPGGHGSGHSIPIATWPQDRPKLLKYLEEEKPDVVKLTYDEHGWGTRPLIPALTPELMRDIILEVNRHGIRTTVHTSSELRATEAIFAGVDSLAHPVIQGPITDDFAALMGAKKTPMATTLTIGEGYSRLVEHPDFLDQPLYQATLTAGEINEMRTVTLPQWKERGWTWWMKLMTPVAQENLRKIDAAGGVIAIATDQTLGPAVHREMELLQSAGVAPAEIIKIATLNGAKHLGREQDLGSIEPGKIADAVLLNSDPTVDINNAKDIMLVMKNGALIDEDKLPLPGGQRPLRRPER